MSQPINSYPEFANFVDAYSYAVTSGVVASILFVPFDQLSNHYSFTELSIMAVVLFVVVWILTACLAILPFFLGAYIARRFKITNWIYFGGVGAFTATLLCLLVAAYALDVDDQHELSFGQYYFHALPLFLASGSIAGTASWLYLRRSFNNYECSINAN